MILNCWACCLGYALVEPTLPWWHTEIEPWVMASCERGTFLSYEEVNVGMSEDCGDLKMNLSTVYAHEKVYFEYSIAPCLSQCWPAMRGDHQVFEIPIAKKWGSMDYSYWLTHCLELVCRLVHIWKCWSCYPLENFHGNHCCLYVRLLMILTEFCSRKQGDVHSMGCVCVCVCVCGVWAPFVCRKGWGFTIRCALSSCRWFLLVLFEYCLVPVGMHCIVQKTQQLVFWALATWQRFHLKG